MRRALAWLVAVPLVLGGAQLAHAVDYWLVSPDAHERSELLAGSGHGYFSYLPFAVALCVALLVAGLAAVIRAAGHGRPAYSLDPWPLALLPIATFVLQEHLERYLHDGAFPWHAVAGSTFVLGLVLQIPFATAAYAVARLLLRAAEAIGSARVSPRKLRPAVLRDLAPAPVDLPSLEPLAGGHPARGPPHLLPA